MSSIGVSVFPVTRAPHENVATVLVEPCVLEDLELTCMALDLRVWPVASAPICPDGPRRAFQIRRGLVMKHGGEWDHASGWTPVWIAFGPAWRHDDDPLPWAAHQALWGVLESYAGHVCFHRRLGGVRPLPLPEESAF
jgi:hypothetical protein